MRRVASGKEALGDGSRRAFLRHVHSPAAGGICVWLDAVDWSSRVPITFAGTPPKIERGGNVLVTTDPAATTDCSETFARMIAPAPIQLSRPMVICWSFPG